MKTVFLSLLFLLCAFSGAQSQIAGGAQEAASFIGSTPEEIPQRYISIPQTSEQEWERLGATFTLETWVWLEPPDSSPTVGNWTGADDENRFLSLISRHPGANVQNEWAHFHLQLTRTTTGPTIVFWSGCGCEGMPVPQPAAPETCGYGYLLSSDSSKISPNNRFWLHPSQWHHIAVTVDGDSITQGLTSGVARLFVDGQLLLENQWASKDNIPPYQTENPCVGRQVYSQTVPGSANEAIYLGYYDNSDKSDSASDNPNLIYGFDGYLDELRIWDTARTPSEIAKTYDLALPPQMNLVGLYNFNGFVSPHTYPNFASIELMPSAVVQGDENDDDQIEENNGLMISQLVQVLGTLPNHTSDVSNTFALLGSSQKGYWITDFSDALTNAIKAGVLVVHDQHHRIDPDSLPYEADLQTITLVWYCEDIECENTIGSEDEVFLSYASIEQSKVFSQVLFDLLPPCVDGFDACGVCGGDNRTCQCVIYHEFRNTRMAYILLTWSLEKIVEKLDDTIQILIDIEDIIESPYFYDWFLEGNYTLAAEVSYMMDFYNLCLSDYCADVTEFVEYLDSWIVSVGSRPTSYPPAVQTRGVPPKGTFFRLPLASPLKGK